VAPPPSELWHPSSALPDWRGRGHQQMDLQAKRSGLPPSVLAQPWKLRQLGNVGGDYQRVALLRRSPPVPGLQPQTKARIIDAHVPVRPAPNSFGHDLGDLLRHNPDVDRVAP
jgi:hypothetical protein